LISFGGSYVIILEGTLVFLPGLDTIPAHCLFYLIDRNFLTMEVAGRKCRLHIGFLEDVDKMLGRACTR
jgi:hypothetical protein